MISATSLPSGDAFIPEATRIVDKAGASEPHRSEEIRRIAVNLERVTRAHIMQPMPDLSSLEINNAERIMARENRKDLLTDQAAELEVREWRQAHPES